MPHSRQHLESLLRQAVDAWNTGDLEGFMAIYHKDSGTTLVTETETIRGYDAIKAYYAAQIGYSVLDFELINALETTSGLDMLAIGTFTVTLGDRSEKQHTFSLLMSPIHDEWKVRLDTNKERGD